MCLQYVEVRKRTRTRPSGTWPLYRDTKPTNARTHVRHAHTRARQVYDGHVYDLLGDGTAGGIGRRDPATGAFQRDPRSSLKLVTDPEGRVGKDAGKEEAGFVPEGAARRPVRTTGALLELVAQASAKRCTGRNSMHEHSSRSHALLTLLLERSTPVPAAKKDEKGHRKGLRKATAQLHLVDLAGSEGADSVRANEGINLGLLALGKVATLAVDNANINARACLLLQLLLILW